MENLATAIITKLCDKNNKTEYEMLMYEQACRLMEVVFKKIRIHLDEEF